MSKLEILLKNQREADQETAKVQRDAEALKREKETAIAVRKTERMKEEVLAALGTDLVSALEETELKATLHPQPTGDNKVELRFLYNGTEFTLSYFNYEGHRSERSLTLSAPQEHAPRRGNGVRTVAKMDLTSHGQLGPNSLSSWLLSSINKDQNLS